MNVSRLRVCGSFVVAFILLSVLEVHAQLPIAHIQPDAVAPGMTIALEIMAPVQDTGNFGVDGLAVTGTSFEFTTASDSNRVTIGPMITSWSGRLLQVPLIVSRYATLGPVVFRIRVGAKISAFATFTIVKPGPAISLSSSSILGSGGVTGNLTAGNTMIVDSILLTGSSQLYRFSNSDTTGAVDNRYLPVTILSAGPVRITSAHLSLDADSALNGGPGGGGGGPAGAPFGGPAGAAGGAALPPGPAAGPRPPPRPPGTTRACGEAAQVATQ